MGQPGSGTGTRRGGRLARVARAPAIHFAVAGLVVFGLVRGLAGPAPLALPAARRAVVEAELERALGRPARPGEIRAALQQELDREILFREALARGLHRRDPVVLMRLVSGARFLDLGAGDDPDELARAALAVGLLETDPVIRRRLVHLVRIGLEAAAEEPPPDAIEAAWRADPDRFRSPRRISFRHVFASRDRHGAGSRAEVRRLLDALRGAPCEAARGLGDPFAGGAVQRRAARRDLERLFGPEFAREVLRASGPGWLGPVPSAFGHHAVCVERVEPGGPVPLEVVAPAIRGELLAERRRQAYEQGMAALRRRYGVPSGRSAPSAPDSVSRRSPASGGGES